MRARTIGDRQISAIGRGGSPTRIAGRPNESRACATGHAARNAS